MNIRIIRIVMTIGLIFVLAGCNQSASVSTPQSSTPSVASPATTDRAPSPTFTLATPYSEQPAAGICASFDQVSVVVTINPDIPDPRCTKVRPDQTLTVINNTMNTLQVSIGDFSTSLLPQAQYSIQVPFGDYLAPGVHQLSVSPCCSAELWLEGK